MMGEALVSVAILNNASDFAFACDRQLLDNRQKAVDMLGELRSLRSASALLYSAIYTPI